MRRLDVSASIQVAAKKESKTDIPSDIDGVDEKAEFRCWEMREMRRLQRDR